jgi:HK97 gp10 family phage protein
MSKQLEVVGLEEVNEILGQLTEKNARNLSRALIHGLASKVAKEAKKKVPEGRTRTLKKAIKAKRKKSPPDKPVSDVYVENGKSAKHDAFYWHMVEYGTGGPVPQPEQPFLRPARDYVQANMPIIIEEEFTKKLTGAINRALKKQAKK